MAGIYNTCRESGEQFHITTADLVFYERMNVPPPTLCPDERARARLAWRNERVLYKRNCCKTGQPIVSIHSEDKPYPVYANDIWWSDAWDAQAYGRELIKARPFFEQFLELYQTVPQQAAQHSKSENCDYTNQSQCNKDCYLVVASNYCRDCLYGMWFQHCTNCIDCLYLEKSELCYEVINGTQCFDCRYSENLENCVHCAFCKNCIGCSNCFGSVNLRNKQYYFFNEPLSKDEYTRRLDEAGISRYSGVLAQGELFNRHRLAYPHKFYTGSLTEEASGDYLREVKDTQECFNCRHTEHVKFCRDAWDARNCYDLVETLTNDFCLELEGCWDCVDCAFSMKLNQAHDVWYSSHCFSSHDLFGCIGLRHAEYCILNRPYPKEEYKRRREEIERQMRIRGEWGEYFPARLSPFGYNETVAQEYFPLDRARALGDGWNWKDEPMPQRGAEEFELADAIGDVSDDVLDRVFRCSESGRPYRVLKQELAFYRQLKIPLPRYHPMVRHGKRMSSRNPRRLYDRKCGRCNVPIRTTFSQVRPEQIYCERCYQEIV